MKKIILGDISEMFQLKGGRAQEYPTDYEELLKSGSKRR